MSFQQNAFQHNAFEIGLYVAPSNDRNLNAPFITRTSRCRRFLRSPDPIVTPVTAVVVPVSAWITRQTPRKRQTDFKRLVISQNAIERYTPPTIAWSNPPTSKKLAWRPKLIKQAPQLLFPPATGPPVSAWTAPKALYFWQDRKPLSPPSPAVFPETPKPEPNLAGRIPVGFFRLKRTDFWSVEPPIPNYPAPITPSVSADRALAVPFVTRKKRARKLQVLPAIPSAPTTPAAPSQPVDATRVTRLKKRRARQGLFLFSGPIVEANVQPQFPSWDTKQTKLRKSLKRKRPALPSLASSPATPAAPAQPVSAWLLKTAILKHDPRRRALAPIPPPSTPATPAPAGEPLASWALKTAYRLEDARRRALLPDQPESTPATPPIPFQAPSSWKLPVQFTRHDSPFKALSPIPPADTPATPFVPPVDTRPVDAGGKKHHRRHFIEIDNQTFEVASYEEAVELLERARDAAKTHAVALSKRIEKRVRRKGSVGGQIAVPSITTSDIGLQEVVANFREKIRNIYLEAAQQAELRELLKKRFAEQDDEEVITLLLH